MIETSSCVNEISTAMAKAQGEINNPRMNRVNKGYNSKYADLAEILNVARAALSKHGIAFYQVTKYVEDGIVLHTRLIHSGGQWIESTYPVTALDTHQKMGAGLTYAKRQALSSLIGVAGEDDLDGEDTKDTTVAKMADKKFSADEAAALYSKLTKDLITIDATSGSSLTVLNKWAADNKVSIGKLNADDQKNLREMFAKIKKDFEDVNNSDDAA
jgi:hypothetical protein